MSPHSARPAYRASLLAAGLSPAFIEAFLGDDAFENDLFTPVMVQPRSYPWPPCFVPLLKYRLGVEAYGVIVHPFHAERPATFGRLSIEDGYVAEVARTEAQFLDVIALESSLGSDDEVVLDAPACTLLRSQGLGGHLPAIQAAAEATGILEEGLSGHLPGFAPDWPFALYEHHERSTYTGGFPCSATAQPACPYEQEYLVAAALVSPEDVPPAATTTPGERWLALQAPGTSLAEARQAVQELQQYSRHPLLGAWLQAAQGALDNY